MADLKAICYERNFLKEVVARIDLAAPVEGLEATLPDKLNDVALANFPLREPRHAVARELQISAKAVEEKRSEFTEWVFHGRLREKTLSIAPEWSTSATSSTTDTSSSGTSSSMWRPHSSWSSPQRDTTGWVFATSISLSCQMATRPTGAGTSTIPCCLSSAWLAVPRS